MYRRVNVSEPYEESLEDMDDRDSIYLDTISVASEAINRRSLTLSRQTIYHSAEDLYEENAGLNEEDEFDGPAPVPTTKISPAAAALTGNSLTKYCDVPGKNDETWRRFQDGERSVDFVLSYLGDDPDPINAEKREAFQRNLMSEGLDLEIEKNQRIHFVKIHAPVEVLCRFCEILKMKMPIKKIEGSEDIIQEEFHLLDEMKSFFGKPFEFVKLDPNLFPERNNELRAEFSREKSYLFDTDRPDFFSPDVRIAVVNFILERQRFGNDKEQSVGIEKLLTDGVYSNAYPLHDGDLKTPDSQRYLLLNEWASVKQWIRHQPLDNIRDYFGARIALYFAWLGFYTHMLIPAAIVGLFCFLYGVATLFSNQISEDICSAGKSIIMCPQCDAKCDYWYLSETCLYSRFAHLIDNNITVFFACFMSIWAVVYLELWKRHSAKIIHRWGLTGFCHQAEHARPQYLARLQSAKKKKFNVVTQTLEPSVPFWQKKFPMYIVSFSVIFLFIFLAVAAVFGVIIYRMSTTTTRNLYGNTDSMSYKIMVTPVTAALLNLVVITIMNHVYDYLAVFLTNLEYKRTQTEYDESLTLKIYLFQFVNYYSSIFYIAFLKGKFVGYPAKYNRIFKLRQEECSPGGCLMELCIQLVIIMVGKQALNAVMEMAVPFLIKTYNTIRNKFVQTTEEDDGDKLICCSQWTEDYKLLAWSSRGLFDDYLEMIIQYGFITIFVVAFPLAPLFALLNNIFEMRLDAKKFLKFYRRPVPKRVKDIGVWYNIMNILVRIAVVSSAFIIAFSSNFIPRLVYMLSVNPDKTDVGYLNHTLAYFNTSDFQEGTAPLQTNFVNVTMCRYPEYRNPPWADRPYKRPLIYWHILAARLAFLVVFQNVVGAVQMLVAWAVPDEPRHLRDRIKREEYLTREIIIEQERLKSAGGKTPVATVPNGGVKVEDGTEVRQRTRKNSADST
ncbi:anoctamin-4 isoform X2 [Phlebotomus papatasi]|uniref:anoctamin-4 isoform X2 n=1 Tax=Phlebotomus papatasi TaxID=29031 RepID=UPI0024843F72|nr:anoctamin-4 isoform X2 [Phlebotomus papatasi]